MRRLETLRSFCLAQVLFCAAPAVADECDAGG
jgi:hypothetical protein